MCRLEWGIMLISFSTTHHLRDMGAEPLCRHVDDTLNNFHCAQAGRGKHFQPGNCVLYFSSSLSSFLLFFSSSLTVPAVPEEKVLHGEVLHQLADADLPGPLNEDRPAQAVVPAEHERRIPLPHLLERVRLG